jgi:hypothetical protein
MPTRRKSPPPMPLPIAVDGGMFGPDGYDRTGYDRSGFNRAGLHRDTKERFNPDGYDRDGRRRRLNPA